MTEFNNKPPNRPQNGSGHGQQGGYQTHPLTKRGDGRRDIGNLQFTEASLQLIPRASIPSRPCHRLAPGWFLQGPSDVVDAFLVLRSLQTRCLAKA